MMFVRTLRAIITPAHHPLPLPPLVTNLRVRRNERRQPRNVRLGVVQGRHALQPEVYHEEDRRQYGIKVLLETGPRYLRHVRLRRDAAPQLSERRRVVVQLSLHVVATTNAIANNIVTGTTTTRSTRRRRGRGIGGVLLPPPQIAGRVG